MWKMAVGVIAVAASTGVAASIYSSKRSDGFGTQPTTSVAQKEVQSTAQSQQIKVTHAYDGRKHRIKADRSGHFITNARMNGRKVEVLVDTGATSVAINKTTARRLGIRLAPVDFKYNVNTANGSVKAAVTTIDRIDLGRVSVRDVRAAVLPDKSLNSTLLGMSFLNELRSFEVRNGELLLSQ